MIANSYIRNSKSWNAFSSKLNSLIVKNKKLEAGKIYEKCVQLFLQTNPKYQSELKHVWLLEEVPKNIRLKLKLPVADEGIDLIAETYRKEYWAIQAKYKTNKDSTLTRKDLSTFRDLAFVTCKNIIHGLVCSPISSEPRKAELMNKTGFALVDEWEALDDNKQYGWKAIQKKLGGKVVKPEKFSPKKHQKQAIKSVLKAFKDKNTERGKMIMPCGTGKSLTAFWIARDMKVKNILLAIPSLSLLQQTLNVWTKEFLANNIRPDYLCVCSDESTGSLEKDEFTSQTYDMGIRTTTDQQAIESFLKNKSNNIKIIFTTYQSGQVTAKASKKTKTVFDLGIMDEAHKTVGHKLKPMAHLIHEKNIKIKKRLFMTATERVFRGGKEDEILSMDNVDEYGDVIYQLSYSEAIKEKIISDYKIITFDISESEYEELFENNNFIRVNQKLKKDDLTARELASAIALRKAIKNLKIKKALSFHSSIKRADKFEDLNKDINKNFKKYSSLETFHVSSKQKSSARVQEMQSFEKSKKALMTNARCLTEGVDVPSIDCVTFIDSKRSKIDIVQAAGRAMRISKGKKYGYILVPIITQNKNLLESSLDTQFENLVSVLTSLSTQDERLIDEIKALSSRSITKYKPRDIIKLKSNVLKKIDIKMLEKNISLKVWNNIKSFSYADYSEAKKFVNNLKLHSTKQWQKYCDNEFKNLPEKPIDIPVNAGGYFRKIGKWNGWGEFLGTGRIADHLKVYWSFSKARKYLHNLRLEKYEDFETIVKDGQLPPEIPSSLISYKKDKRWKGNRDFVGVDYKFGSKYLKYITYNEAKILAHKSKLKTSDEWYLYTKKKTDHKIKKPANIPTIPNAYYKNKGWKGWKEFLGETYNPNWSNELRKNSLLKFEDAKKLIATYKLNGINDFKKFKNSKNYPKSLSKNPYHYKSHPKWNGLLDYLGKKK